MVSNEVYVAIVEAKEQVSDLFEIHGDLMSSVEESVHSCVQTPH